MTPEASASATSSPDGARRPQVGWLGLGNMGRPMAANVLAASYDLLAFDAAGTDERLPAGARAAESVQEVLTADVVFLSVPDGRATLTIVEACETSERLGLTSMVDLSTVGPAVALEAAERLERLGITYADGPVSGGTAGAAAGTVSLMFGGPRALFDDLHPVLSAISSNPFHVGGHAGQGQVMKLLNNFLSATALAATTEALAFGSAHGLELPAMLEVLNVSSGRNSATVDKFPNRVVTGGYDAGFATQLMTKDVTLLQREAAAAGVHRDIIDQVVASWRSVNEALPRSDFTEIWRHFGPEQLGR